MAQSIRRVLRAYHCHACNQDFREMVDLNDLASVKCSHCQSDFLEEKRSFEAEPQPQAQAQPQPQPQPQQQNAQPQMRFSHQQSQQRQGFSQFPPAQAQADQQPRQAPRMQQQTFTRRYSPNGGWTQSVTVSFGAGNNVMQQSQQIPVRQGGAQMPAQQMPAANEFASAAHAQQPQQPQQQQQQQRAQPQNMGGFFSNSGPQMVDPFQHMDDFFQGPMQGMGGFFQGQQRPQPQQQNPHQGFFQQMFGGEGGLGNVFFANGFPMDENRPGSRGGCTEEFITNLPEKESEKESDCYICLEKCKEGKESCQLPCGHAFDRNCITGWLKDHDSCPVCRVKLDQGRPQAQQQPQQQPHGFFF